MTKVKTALKDNFLIPEANIKQLIRPSGEELVNALKWMQQMEENNLGAEALVYVVAHGMSEPDWRLPEELQDKQGAYQGTMALNSEDDLTEAQMKALFNKYLSKFKAVNLLMAPCHSGAWISKADTPAVKPGNPFAFPGGDNKKLA
jgi:hypothetical protein